MTLQASGAITLANVQTEFGGANPISLSEYYGADTGVPASGAISMSQFYGKSSVVQTTMTVTEGTTNPGGKVPTDYWGYNDAAATVGIAAFGSRTPATHNGVTINSFYVSGLGTNSMLVYSTYSAAFSSKFSRIYIEGYGWTPATSWTVAAGVAPYYSHQFTHATFNFNTTGGWNGSGTRIVIFEHL